MKPVNKHIEMPEKILSEKAIKRRSFIAFGSFAVLGSAGYFGWRKLYTSTVEPKTITAGAHQPLRKAINQNELIFRRLFNRNQPARTYPKALAARHVRQNGDIGLGGAFDISTWTLNVQRAPGDILRVTLDELKALPKTEIVFDFKCVEGWDQIQHWAGVKFTDFITHYHLEPQTRMDYVGMATPDNQYYVGLDMDSAMHTQTILAYEMNDKPLTPDHGAPLRLIIPVKYGIKNLKRISTITFSNTRPPDYWAELGYDYYSGL